MILQHLPECNMGRIDDHRIDDPPDVTVHEADVRIQWIANYGPDLWSWIRDCGDAIRRGNKLSIKEIEDFIRDLRRGQDDTKEELESLARQMAGMEG